MQVESITVDTQSEIFVAAPCQQVYEFVSDVETRVDPVSPLDASERDTDGLEPDSLGMCELKLAGRVLTYESLIREAVPAGRFRVVMRGDVQGEQVFQLSEEGEGTRLQLRLSYQVPPAWPAYYRDEPTRSLFADTLVSQTLANIKAALETG